MSVLHFASRCAALGLSVALAGCPAAEAQTSSLLAPTAQQRPLTLDRYSWTYQKAPEVKPVQVHDIVTIQVTEKSVVISEGSMDRKKKASVDAVLKDWVLLDKLTLYP